MRRVYPPLRGEDLEKRVGRARAELPAGSAVAAPGAGRALASSQRQRQEGQSQEEDKELQDREVISTAKMSGRTMMSRTIPI